MISHGGYDDGQRDDGEQHTVSSCTAVDAQKEAQKEMNLRKFNQDFGLPSLVSLLQGYDEGMISTKRDRDMNREAPIKANAWETSDEVPDTSERDALSKGTPSLVKN